VESAFSIDLSPNGNRMRSWQEAGIELKRPDYRSNETVYAGLRPVTGAIWNPPGGDLI
jgi:hypothetical protein